MIRRSPRAGFKKIVKVGVKPQTVSKGSMKCGGTEARMEEFPFGSHCELAAITP